MMFVFWQLQSIMSKMLEHIHDFSILVSMVGSLETVYISIAALTHLNFSLLPFRAHNIIVSCDTVFQLSLLFCKAQIE